MVGPASQRAASFARHLPALGWDPLVVTVRCGLYHSDPRNLAPAVPTMRTLCPEPGALVHFMRTGRRASRSSDAPRSIAEGRRSGAGHRAQRLVRNYAYIPDGLAGWIPFAVAAIRRALRFVPRPAVLLSTSVPYSAHVAALVAARLENVPWVAEFRDPWSQIDDQMHSRSSMRKRIDASLEAKVVAGADALVVTSALTRESMAQLYPQVGRERIVLVRNGFEATAIAGAPPPPAEALELVHAGSVRQEVAIEPLLRGIDRVARSSGHPIRLQVLGPPEPWQRAADAVGGLGWLDIRGVVTPSTARGAVARASAVIILYPGATKRELVAAKLMDCLGARRPIVGIFSERGEMATLARAYGDLRLVDPYVDDAISDVVRTLLAEHVAGRLQQPTCGGNPIDALSMSRQVGELAKAFDTVIGPAADPS
ncbi:MAG: glycosyltransferase [Solirubrobacteraceae bacterium]